jgi:hypothetical protein
MTHEPYLPLPTHLKTNKITKGHRFMHSYHGRPRVYLFDQVDLELENFHEIPDKPGCEKALGEYVLAI